MEMSEIKIIEDYNLIVSIKDFGDFLVKNMNIRTFEDITEITTVYNKVNNMMLTIKDYDLAPQIVFLLLKDNRYTICKPSLITAEDVDKYDRKFKLDVSSATVFVNEFEVAKEEELYREVEITLSRKFEGRETATFKIAVPYSEADNDYQAKEWARRNYEDYVDTYNLSWEEDDDYDGNVEEAEFEESDLMYDGLTFDDLDCDDENYNYIVHTRKENR